MAAFSTGRSSLARVSGPVAVRCKAEVVGAVDAETGARVGFLVGRRFRWRPFGRPIFLRFWRHKFLIRS